MGLSRHRRHRAGHRRTSGSQEAKWARLGSESLWSFKSVRDISEYKSVRNARQASSNVSALSAGAAAQPLSGVKTTFSQVSTEWRPAIGALVADDEWASQSENLSSQPVACASGFGPKWSDFWSDPYELNNWAGALECSLRRPSSCSSQFSLNAECRSSVATAVTTMPSNTNTTVESTNSGLSPSAKRLAPLALDIFVNNDHAAVGPSGASGACAAGVTSRFEQLPSGADFLPRYISAFGETSGEDSKAWGLPPLPSHITVFGDNESFNSRAPGNGGDEFMGIGTCRQRVGDLLRMQHTHANADGPGFATTRNAEAGFSDHGVWAHGQGGSENLFTQIMLTTSVPEPPAAPVGNPLVLGDSFSPARAPVMGLGLVAGGPGVDATHIGAVAQCSPLRGVVKVRKTEVSDETKIGEGAFGEVSRADLFPYGDVAIKWIKPEHIAKHSDAFHIEAEILANLNHPNVVRMFGVVTGSPAGDNAGDCNGGGVMGVSDPVVGIVTEFMGNGTLGQVLRSRNGRLSTRQCARIALQVALGMAYLHAQSPAIVHFDLKPENVLIQGDGENMVAKIADFGLSKPKHGKYVSCPMPRGTLPYMAPEVVFGNGEVSEKVDVYSMGVTLWQLLTGEEPFMRLSNQEILMGLESGTLHLPIPSTCDPEWRSLVETCMDPNPENRPSFRELATQLRGILNGKARTVNTSCPCAEVAVAAAVAVLDSDTNGRTLPRLPVVPLAPATPIAPAVPPPPLPQQQHAYLQDVLPPPHPLLRLFQQPPPPPPPLVQALPYQFGNLPYVLLPQAMVQNALKAQVPPAVYKPPPPLFHPLPMLSPATPQLLHVSPPPTRPSTPPLQLEQPLLFPQQQQCNSPLRQQRKPLAAVQGQHLYGNPMVLQAACHNVLQPQPHQNELAFNKARPQLLQPLPLLPPQLLQHTSPPPTPPPTPPPQTPPPQLEHPLFAQLQQQYVNQGLSPKAMRQNPLQAQLHSYKPQLTPLQQNRQLQYLMQLAPPLL
ncbi:hypothetical protein Vafri_6329 [Volvox africanus]|uniref:Protein kinase domain-containing protein n=1 Tax=Volvox africanus TaxID=51714 RepID=A0A8J4AYD9_9CHLO|nr:hypothetical protein Vafri_6329 [Volvox africanus]